MHVDESLLAHVEDTRRFNEQYLAAMAASPLGFATAEDALRTRAVLDAAVAPLPPDRLQPQVLHVGVGRARRSRSGCSCPSGRRACASSSTSGPGSSARPGPVTIAAPRSPSGARSPWSASSTAWCPKPCRRRSSTTPSTSSTGCAPTGGPSWATGRSCSSASRPACTLAVLSLVALREQGRARHRHRGHGAGLRPLRRVRRPQPAPRHRRAGRLQRRPVAGVPRPHGGAAAGPVDLAALRRSDGAAAGAVLGRHGRRPHRRHPLHVRAVDGGGQRRPARRVPRVAARLRHVPDDDGGRGPPPHRRLHHGAPRRRAPVRRRGRRRMSERPPSGVLPFRGVRVLDLAAPVSAYCGRVLAGYGADVLRLERPGAAVDAAAADPRAAWLDAWYAAGCRRATLDFADDRAAAAAGRAGGERRRRHRLAHGRHPGHRRRRRPAGARLVRPVRRDLLPDRASAPPARCATGGRRR